MFFQVTNSGEPIAGPQHVLHLAKNEKIRVMFFQDNPNMQSYLRDLTYLIKDAELNYCISEKGNAFEPREDPC